MANCDRSDIAFASPAVHNYVVAPLAQLIIILNMCLPEHKNQKNNMFVSGQCNVTGSIIVKIKLSYTRSPPKAN